MLSAVENSRRASHEVYGISQYAKLGFKDSELPGSRWRETGYDETAVVPLLVGNGPLRDRRVRFVMCLKKGGTRRYCHNSIDAGSFRTTRKTEPNFFPIRGTLLDHAGCWLAGDQSAAAIWCYR